MAKKNVLVTGATGFVGSHVADLLYERGYNVRCNYRKTSNLRWLKDKPYELVEASLSDPDSLKKAVEGIHYIFHVAGLTAAKTEAEFLSSNKTGTENLIKAALENSSIEKFIYISSQTVGGPSTSFDKPVCEEDAPNPITAYARSKKSGEDIAIAYKDQLDVVILRAPAVYGPRDTAIFSIFKTVKMGLATVIGFNDKRVSLIHVKDLARGIADAAESENTAGQIYYISSEKFYSWNEVFDVMKKYFSSKMLIKIKIPHFLVLSIAGISGFAGKFMKKPPVFNYDKGIDFIQAYWTCSPEKAKKDFGFKQEISLDEGIKNTIEWYKKHKWL